MEHFEALNILAMNSSTLFFQSHEFLGFFDIYYLYHIRQYYQITVSPRNKKIMYIYRLLLFVWSVLVMYLNHMVCDFVRTYKHMNSLKKEATYSHFIVFLVKATKLFECDGFIDHVTVHP